MVGGEKDKFIAKIEDRKSGNLPASDFRKQMERENDAF
jgi:hypothetical protein